MYVRLSITLSAVLLGLMGSMAVGCSPSRAEQQGAQRGPLAGAERIDRRGIGDVVERLSAGRYTYLRLGDSAPGEWLVVLSQAPAVGESFAYRAYGVVKDFRSAKLEREFPRLLFASANKEKTR